MFISYRSLEFEPASHLAQALFRAGIPTWTDTCQGIRGSEDWPIVLQKALDTCSAMGVLLSPSYAQAAYMRRDLAPLLFDDDDKESAQRKRASVVEPAQRSDKAQRKATTKRTEDGQPVHSFRTQLMDLATICRNRIQPKIAGTEPFEQLTRLTPLQQRAFDLLQVTCRL